MGDEESLRVKVSEHAIQLATMSHNLIEIKDTMKNNSESLSKIAVILEKLTNIENNDIQSTNRIHKLIESEKERITETIKRVDVLDIQVSHIKVSVKKHNDTIEELVPFVMMVRYPKLALSSMTGAYLLTIKEVRDALAGLVG